MAFARRCDVCGKYYTTTIQDVELIYDTALGMDSSMIRILSRKDGTMAKHDIMQFDTCEDCKQDVLDYILNKQAEWTKKGE